MGSRLEPGMGIRGLSLGSARYWKEICRHLAAICIRRQVAAFLKIFAMKYKGNLRANVLKEVEKFLNCGNIANGFQLLEQDVFQVNHRHVIFTNDEGLRDATEAIADGFIKAVKQRKHRTLYPKISLAVSRIEAYNGAHSRRSKAYGKVSQCEGYYVYNGEVCLKEGELKAESQLKDTVRRFSYCIATCMKIRQSFAHTWTIIPS